MAYGLPKSGMARPGAAGQAQSSLGRRGANGTSEIKDKTISYNSANSEQILNIKSLATVGTTKEAIPGRVEIQNVGGVPIMIMSGYETYSSDTADGVLEFLHTMVLPGETFLPPVRAIIRTGESSVIMDGTVVDNAAPDSNEYTDSTADVDHATASTMGSDATHTTLNLEDGHSKFFMVGDLIRMENEICEVTAVGTGADLVNSTLTIIRGLYGSTAATHADDIAVRLPFFNAYHDFDKYSVAQTDGNGKFKAYNFFGLGRASSGVLGLVPGSIAIKFYEAGYQSLGLSGITSSTDTKLEASGSYWFKIAIDGGTAEAINFTVDVTTWGGTNGVLSKMQDAMNDKYDNSASNTFQQRSYVGIVDGDIRFTSGQSLSTSAIALTAGTDGASASYNIFAQQNGHTPALANIRDAIPARLPDDVIYDKITYIQSPNTSVFCYDNGSGILFGMCRGTINYETGAIDMIGCPPNAEFVYSVAHTSAFSGKLNDGTADRVNSLSEVYANTPSTKWDGKVQTRIYK